MTAPAARLAGIALAGIVGLGSASIVAAVPPGVPAVGPDVHVVVPGDSASALARRYYGDPAAWRRLMEFNGRATPDLVPGERLRLPSSRPHAVRAGETGSALALAAIGDSQAWEAIARLNGLDPQAPLSVGERLILPAMQERALCRGESLARIAAELYGDTSLGAVLQRLNRIDDPRRLAPGHPLRLPRLDFLRVDATPAAVSQTPASPASPAGQREPQPARGTATPRESPVDPALERALRAAAALYEEGHYRAALDALARVDSEAGRAAASRRRLTAFSWIALDEFDRACRAWNAVAGSEVRDRAADLDPVQVSPKIRDVLTGCETPAREG